jgi:DNA-binding beta-propeller fold protein YncE
MVTLAWRAGLAGAVVAGAVIGAAVACQAPAHPAPARPVLRVTATVQLPGDGSRWDYASLDTGRGLLFAAHLGASEVVEVNIGTRRVVRTIRGLAQVHGVLVVPALHRVYATATGAGEVARIDEDSGRVLGMTPTGAYPDGLAYDPVHGTVWTTNESGGSETIIDAATGAARGSVPLGGEAGNVAYDPASRLMLADVQTRDELAVIDPATLAVTRRVPLPGCDHDHGLTLDSARRLAFIACDGNAALLTLDLDRWRVTGTAAVGAGPDVLAYDARAGRLYVAGESGWVTVLARHGRRLDVAGSQHLADGAHVVAVDPGTGRSYFPVPRASGGHPALLICELA